MKLKDVWSAAAHFVGWLKGKRLLVLIMHSIHVKPSYLIKDGMASKPMYKVRRESYLVSSKKETLVSCTLFKNAL